MKSSHNHQDRIVVKVGTSTLSRPEGGLDRARVQSLADELAGLRREGYQILLVTSGAIGAGMGHFGWTVRPKTLREKQAAAAVGQVVLMESYRDSFQKQGLSVAQVLLTRQDLEDRKRYLNIRASLFTLLKLGVVPVINENDTVSTDEIQIGDNDTLAALVACKMDARSLVILTDVEGLLDKGSGASAGSEPVIHDVVSITSDIERLAGKRSGSRVGVGGMATKLRAAQMVAASGIEMWIVSGRKNGLIREALSGRRIGTHFHAQKESLSPRRRWIAFGRRIQGSVTIDDGAASALLKKGRSLLSAGVTGVQGDFHRGDTVRVLTADSKEIARGLVSYEAVQVRQIVGRKSADVRRIFGTDAAEEVIHRDNLVLIPRS
ncbi:MAG TPA: glutamate 5-kinase [Elusimicrobiota bacterium]|nr:glutamate 5-kinase [Elusimicrobiota bacterium]